MFYLIKDNLVNLLSAQIRLVHASNDLSISNTLLMSHILYILSPLPIIFFIFMVASAVVDYLKHRVEGGTLYLSKMEVCFGDCQFFF